MQANASLGRGGEQGVEGFSSLHRDLAGEVSRFVSAAVPQVRGRNGGDTEVSRADRQADQHQSRAGSADRGDEQEDG